MNRRQIFVATALAAAAGPAFAQTPAAPAADLSAKPTTPLFPDDEEFWFETVRMFGCRIRRGASFGEVLATAGRIKSGDYDSWYDGWNAIADRIAGEADAQLARRHRINGATAIGGRH